MYDKWIKLPADPKTNFAGKTIIVTGANTGLGLQASVKFPKLGASKIILAVRDLENGSALKAEIESLSKR